VITKARSGVLCDYCKDAYGWYFDTETKKNRPHPKALKQAFVTITSETSPKEPVIRSYCYSHVQELSTWSDGSIWTLEEQVKFAKVNRRGVQLTIGGYDGI
jgi:hypothetical protein